MEANSILRISNLHVSYGEIQALRGIDLEVNEGEIVTLIGSNGAGKSTVVNSILGIVKPLEGKIEFCGEDVTGKTSDKIVRMGIAVVPEGRGILAQMTVLENLLLGAYHSHGNHHAALESIYTNFPIIEQRKHQVAGTLSGGEQQMLAIGRALMGTPKMLMLDEPSLALAPAIVDQVFNILSELRKNGGLTILISEQLARKALHCADRGYVLDLGRVAIQGTSAELTNNPEVKKAYLGG